MRSLPNLEHLTLCYTPQIDNDAFLCIPRVRGRQFHVLPLLPHEAAQTNALMILLALTSDMQMILARKLLVRKACMLGASLAASYCTCYCDDGQVFPYWLSLSVQICTGMPKTAISVP